MTETLAEVLESPRCACGRPKRIQRPFCLDCYNAIPLQSRRLITYTSDQGAYNAALEYLERHVYVNQSQARSLC